MTGDADAHKCVEVLHLLYAPVNGTACLTHSISNILWLSNIRPPNSTWLRYVKAVYHHSQQKNTEVGLGFSRHWSELWLSFSVIFSALLIPLGLPGPSPMISRWRHPQISMLPYSHPQLSDHRLTLDCWDTLEPTEGPGGGHALRSGSPDLPSTVPGVLGTWTGVDSTTQAAKWWGGTHLTHCLTWDFSHDTFGIHHFKKMRRKTTTGSFPSPKTPRKKNTLDTCLLGARPWMRCWKRKRKDRLLDLGALWGRLPSWVQPQPQAPGCMRTPSWSKGQSGLQRGGGTRLFRWVLPAGSELTDSPGPGGCRNRAAVAPLRTFTLLSLPPVHERQMLAIADWERKETVWFGKTILCSPPPMVLPPSDLCF